MSETFDCTSEDGRTAGIEAAVTAVRGHEIVVLPTDTVYGVGADAFSPEGVRAVLAAKGRGADMPPPVLIPHARTADGLATSVPAYARDLMSEFWPGPLTLVLLAQPSLMWDLGDTNGTVALRVPQDQVALDLLAQVGPMAVTSANLTGRPAALTAREALLMLGDAVSVYLDGGPSTGGEASTILDCTQEQPRILREGAIPVEELERVLGDVPIEGRQGPDGAMTEVLPTVPGPGYTPGLPDDADDGDVPVVAATEDVPYVPRHAAPEPEVEADIQAQPAAAPLPSPGHAPVTSPGHAPGHGSAPVSEPLPPSVADEVEHAVADAHPVSTGATASGGVGAADVTRPIPAGESDTVEWGREDDASGFAGRPAPEAHGLHDPHEPGEHSGEDPHRDAPGVAFDPNL